MRRTDSTPLSRSMLGEPASWNPSAGSQHEEIVHSLPMEEDSYSDDVNDQEWSSIRGHGAPAVWYPSAPTFYYSADEGPFDEPCDPIDDLVEAESE